MRLLPQFGIDELLDVAVHKVATHFPEDIESEDRFGARLQEVTVTNFAAKVKESGLPVLEMPNELVCALLDSKSKADIEKEYRSRKIMRKNTACILGVHYTLNKLGLGPSLRKSVYLFHKISGQNEQTGWNLWRRYGHVSHFLLAELIMIDVLAGHHVFNKTRCSPAELDKYKSNARYLFRSQLKTAIGIYKYGVNFVDSRTKKPLLDAGTAWIIPEACTEGGDSYLDWHGFTLRDRELAWLDEYSKRNI